MNRAQEIYGFIKHANICTIGVPDGEERYIKGRKNIWRNNSPKFPQSEENYEYIHSRSLTNSNSNGKKTQRQREKFESNKREATHHR